MKEYLHFINNEWIESESNEWFESENPYTGKTWAKISKGSELEVDKATQAANQALTGDWGSHTATARGKLLVKLAEIIEEDSAREIRQIQ